MLENIKNTSDDPINKKCHDLCLNVWRKYSSGKIVLKELLEEAAYIALAYGFDELRVYYFPAQPKNRIFDDYNNLNKKEKEKLDPSYFTKNYQITDYYAQCKKIMFKNIAVYDWLSELKTYIPESDFNRQNILDRRIENFRIWFINNKIDIESRNKQTIGITENNNSVYEKTNEIEILENAFDAKLI